MDTGCIEDFPDYREGFLLDMKGNCIVLSYTRFVLEGRVFDFSSIAGFDWDKGNKQKNWDKHQVDFRECEEVFFNRPLIVGEDKTHSAYEKRFNALGQSDAGRLLFLAFTIRNDKIRVVSAREQTEKERKKYAR